MQTLTITTSSRPQQIVEAGEGPVLFFNKDPTNSVWFGENIGIRLDNLDTVSELPAGAALVLDGRRNVYALPSPANVSINLSKIPGGQNFFQLVEIIIKTLIINSSAGNGVYVYNPVEGANNLLASIAGANGTDPSTFNNVLAGIAEYGVQFSNFYAIQLLNAGINFYQGGATESVAYGQVGRIQLVNPAAGGLLISTNGFAQANPITLQAAANKNIDIMSPLVWTTAIGVEETWHNLGAPIAGWTVGGRARYKFLADSGLVIVELENIQLPAGGAVDGTNIWTSANGLPLAYRPIVQSGRNPCYFNGGAGGESPAWAFNTDGSIATWGTGGTTIARLDMPYYIFPAQI